MAINNRYTRKSTIKLYAKIGAIVDLPSLPQYDNLDYVQEDFRIDDVIDLIKSKTGDRGWINHECGGDYPTGFFVLHDDCRWGDEYSEIYVTFDRAPYLLSATYYQIVRNW